MMSGITLTINQYACQCEHTDHFNDYHPAHQYAQAVAAYHSHTQYGVQKVCSDCAMHHCDESKITSMTTPGTALPAKPRTLKASELRTQKARGVAFLASSGSFQVPRVAYWQGDIRPDHAQEFPLFARPCPTTPRHGFVDSRVVQSREEAEAVYAEALAADPDAELMLMPLIRAQCSMVITPRWAAVGNGHDGATAGKAGTIAVPMLHTQIPAPSELVPSGQIPYVETVHGVLDSKTFVGNCPNTYTVQLRSGPEIGGQGVGDYVPNDMTVARVINAHDCDAMELEAEIADAVARGESAGLAIWQAGGNPCSHAACHARLNGLAIVFADDAPTIGATLKQSADAALEMDEAAFAEALRFYGADTGVLPEHMNSGLLWGVHQAPAIATVPQGAAYSAYACTQLWRYAAIAAIGEARHSYRTSTGRRRRNRAKSRSASWQAGMVKPATHGYLRQRAAIALAAFEDDDNFSSGYGGKTWAKCTHAALALYDAIARCSVGKGSAAEVILAAHGVVNSAHNDGPFLNKFIGGEAFDSAAGGALYIAQNGLVDMHAQATLRAIAEALGSVSAKAWPKRVANPPKAKGAVNADRVQWNLRQDGTALHAQYRRADNHRSATIPLATLPAEQRAAIARRVAFDEPTLTSSAGTKSMYWPAVGTLTAETLAILFP